MEAGPLRNTDRGEDDLKSGADNEPNVQNLPKFCDLLEMKERERNKCSCCCCCLIILYSL